MFKIILGTLVIIFGTFDGIKYHWFAKKIKETKTSRSYSRKGLNVAIMNNFIRIVYGIYIIDWFIILSSLFAALTMIYCWYEIYLFYPYRYRGLISFKRPNIMIYLINSIVPNKLRKRL